MRTDVTLVNLSLANTDWHLRQIQRRQTPEFNPATSIDLWKPRSDTSAVRLGCQPGGWRRPTTSPFSLSIPELDSLPEMSSVKKGQVFKVGDIEIKFGTEYVEKKDLAVIFLIRDNLGKRPIYFAWSDANYPDETLGLTQYLVSQGLVRKLYPEPAKEGGPIEFTTLGFTDIPRTKDAAPDLPLGKRHAGPAAGVGGSALRLDPPALLDRVRARRGGDAAAW